MPTFDTPGPISVSIKLLAGNVMLTAEDRTDTEVTVEPNNPEDESDIQLAEQTRVEYANGTLSIKGPTLRGYVSWANKSRTVAVTIKLPTGSHLYGTASVANLNATGRLGECEFKSGAGNILLSQTETVRLQTVGDINVDQVAGVAELSTSSGKLQLGQVSGNANLKNSNGNSWIGEVQGATRVRSSNGDIMVDRAQADIDAVTAYGSVRVGRTHHGSVELKTGMGELEIGVPEGTAAWVDAQTGYGKVRNLLNGSAEPGPDVPIAKIQAHTAFGDVVIRRSET